MPRVCGYVGAAPGNSQSQIIQLTLTIVAGSTLRIQVLPVNRYRGHYYGIYVNGIYRLTKIMPLIGLMDVAILLDPGTTVASAYLEDFGFHQPNVGDYIPTGQANILEAATSARVALAWQSTYEVTSILYDSQLSSVSIAGAIRVFNCLQINGRPTRGRISYSILTVGSQKQISFWSGNQLVAQGSRIGNGVVNLVAINGSGLSGVVTMTYSADLIPGVAFIEMRWPSGYQIHWSQTAMSFPRTPQATITDNLKLTYNYLTTPLTSATWYLDVLKINDDGTIQTTNIPVEQSVVLNYVPASVTGVTTTGTAAALTVNWTDGEVGDTYTVYSSKINQAINFGDFSAPAPVITAINATSATLPAITGYASIDNTSTITAFFSAVTGFVATLQTAYGVSEASFIAALPTFQTLFDAQVTSLQLVTSNITVQQTYVDGALNQLISTVGSYAGLYSFSDWQAITSPYFLTFLAAVGAATQGNVGLYSLPNGLTATGVQQALIPISQALQPYVQYGSIYFVIRAKKSGIEETQDIHYVVQFDNSGNIVLPRPNTPSNQGIAVITNGLTIQVNAVVIGDNSIVDAVTLNMYVGSSGFTPTIGSPSATSALPNASANAYLQQAFINFSIGSAGVYDIYLASVSAAGGVSYLSNKATIIIDSVSVTAVADLTTQVIRGIANG